MFCNYIFFRINIIILILCIIVIIINNDRFVFKFNVVVSYYIYMILRYYRVIFI